MTPDRPQSTNEEDAAMRAIRTRTRGLTAVPLIATFAGLP
jgi:hypothetical protein